MNLMTKAFFAFALLVSLNVPVMAGDTLQQAKKRGVLVVGVRNMMPPFGFVDQKHMAYVGYDVDFATAIANRLGVKLELRTSSKPLIPLLQNGDVDLIAGAMTKTAKRQQQIDFSYGYFLTGQKFLAKKSRIKTLKDLEGQKIGTGKGSSSEQNLKNALPGANILTFPGYREAFRSLSLGAIVAISTDEPLLAGLLVSEADKAQYEIPDISISEEVYGLGIRKDDKPFLDLVNQTLLEMEKNGEAAKIFDKWFGPASARPMERRFKITAGK